MPEVELEIGSVVETKIAQYINKNGERVQKSEKATTIIKIGTIGRITKLENMPMPNSAQVYFSEFDMYVAYSISNLKPPHHINLKQHYQKNA